MLLASRRTRTGHAAPRALLFSMLGLAILVYGVARLSVATAANPSGGTLSSPDQPLTYSAGPFTVPNPSAQINGTPQCGTGMPCDDFALNVSVPSSYANNYTIRAQIQWPLSTADFDLYVLDSNGNVIAESATSNDPEVVSLPATSGNYTIRTIPFDPQGQSYNGTISLVPKPAPPVQGGGIAPRYQNYFAPLSSLGSSAGEPSIGVNYATGSAYIESVLQTLRVKFNDATSPAGAVWEDKSPILTSQETLDPIMFVDHNSSSSNRVIVSQLAGTTSLSEYSDDDGETWSPSQGGGIASGVDHQTVGGGPFAPPVPSTLYPHAVYYCSQDVADAACALSLDGGRTYGPAHPIYNIEQCGGLHGHVKVAPDGTVYVPNKGCGSTQGLAVSTDDGTTWTVNAVTGSTPAIGSDPSVGIGSGGRVYFGYQNGDGHPYIAVSDDKGQTWHNNQDVGTPFGIQNIVFPEVVAGDNDRAAFAFLGTPTGGDYQAVTDFTNGTGFQGIWHLYIATTYDGGKTWITVDATPEDPVQRGSICTAGTTCGNDRNLLDFMDVTIDSVGRVLVGYADGCIGGCVESAPNTFSARATIARQSGGRRLLAKYDPAEPSVPAAINGTGYKDKKGVHLSWPEPDNGGSPITGYKIYRQPATSNTATLIATIPNNTIYVEGVGDRASYDDLTVANTSNVRYVYKVVAVNSVGDGRFSGYIHPGAVPAAPNPCTQPGVIVTTDPTGDQVGAPANSDLDIQYIGVAEPYFRDGSQKLVFTMKVANLSTILPNRQWKIIWNFTGGPRYYVGMNSDATGKVTYDYGTVADTTNMPTSDGPADAGSYTASGLIQITISNSKIGNPKPGNTLGVLDGRTFAGQGNVTVTKAAAADSTNDVAYTLVGNSFCKIPTPTEVYGSGSLVSATAVKFSMDVKQNLTGTFSYQDRPNNVGFNTKSFSSFSSSGAVGNGCATFGGPATTLGGRSVTYSATACSNSGSADTFGIQVKDQQGKVISSRSGPLFSGSINLR